MGERLQCWTPESSFKLNIGSETRITFYPFATPRYAVFSIWYSKDDNHIKAESLIGQSGKCRLLKEKVGRTLEDGRILDPKVKVSDYFNESMGENENTDNLSRWEDATKVVNPVVREPDDDIPF